MEAVLEKEHMSESDILNDMASGVISCTFSIGGLFAPIFGGYMNDVYGYRTTCDMIAVIALAFGVFYAVGNLLPFYMERRQMDRILKGFNSDFKEKLLD